MRDNLWASHARPFYILQEKCKSPITLVTAFTEAALAKWIKSKDLTAKVGGMNQFLCLLGDTGVGACVDAYFHLLASALSHLVVPCRTASAVSNFVVQLHSLKHSI